MAIRLITGAPGSGKSFYVVKHLVDNYYQVGAKGLLEPKPGVTCITNVDNLRLDHLNLTEAIEKSGVGSNGFFTVGYQEKIIKKYGRLVYVIDECQRFFDEYFRDKDVIYFFEYHRHLGLDIYLVSQNSARICRAIRDLAETEVRAVRRMASFFGELKYNVMCGGEILDKKVLKKDKGIFQLYQSMTAGETEKIRNPMKKYLIGAVAFIVVGFLLFYNTFFGGMGAEKTSKKGSTSSLGVASAAAAALPGVKPVNRKLYPVDFAAVGGDVFVLSPDDGSLVFIDRLPYESTIVSKGEVVYQVYLLLTPDEYEHYKSRILTAPPSTERGGGQKPSTNRFSPPPPAPSPDRKKKVDSGAD